MLRILSLLASYWIGKSLQHPNGTDGAARLLIRLPLLMIRKILKLFMVGFGSLLVGVSGIEFLLKEILFQLQTERQIVLNASTGISSLVVLVGLGSCAWTFRKMNWVDAGDLTDPAEPGVIEDTQHQPDLMTVIIALVSNLLNEKANRRMSVP